MKKRGQKVHIPIIRYATLIGDLGKPLSIEVSEETVRIYVGGTTVKTSKSWFARYWKRVDRMILGGKDESSRTR